jgi:hypothetical protein
MVWQNMKLNGPICVRIVTNLEGNGAHLAFISTDAPQNRGDQLKILRHSGFAGMREGEVMPIVEKVRALGTIVPNHSACTTADSMAPSNNNG